MVLSARLNCCARPVAFFSAEMALNSTSRTVHGIPMDGEQERDDKQAEDDMIEVTAQHQAERIGRSAR